MSSTDNISLLEVDYRLTILQHNIQCLRQAAEYLAVTADDPLPFVSLTQAFYDEERQLEAARAGEPDDRYATLDHTMSNLATIRQDADAEAITALDAETEGTLRTWN